jgi:hypothetical protein
MSLNRASKALFLVAALAVIAALCWRLASPSSVGQPESVSRPSMAAPTVATLEPAVTAHGPTPLAIPVIVNRADDAKCIVKSLPPPTVAAAEDEPEVPRAATRPAIVPDPARAQILARMKSSADPYANAVAIWLDVAEGPDDDTARGIEAERTHRLAAMAASTKDPRLYALALRTCWGRASQACEGLSARRWAEIEPDNAMPWLMMLDESARHEDVSGMQEAMFHVTQSRRLAERNQAPLQPIIDAATGDPESLIAARALAIDAIGISAAQVGPIGYTACKGVLRANANVWQQCVAMTDLLENRSDSLYARQVGASIDKRLTGNTKPGEQVAAQMKRWMAVDLASSSGCGDLRAKLALLRRMAVEGEVAATAGAGR